MLDINFIRKNVKTVQKAAQEKNIKIDLKRLLFLDEKRRDIITEIENLRRDQNKISQNVQNPPQRSDIERSKAIKNKIELLEKKLKEILPEFEELMLNVPNLASPDTPKGKDENDNIEIKRVGSSKKKIKESHEEIAKRLNLIDQERAVKIGGTRAYILKNQLTILEQSVLRYALDVIQKEGFEVMNVPILVRREALIGSGFFPFGKDDIFQIDKDLYLAGTSEAPLIYSRANETLKENELPVLICGITPCFRKEVGSYGKETKGFFRVHQFNKVEQVVLCRPEDSEKMFYFILSIAEKILKDFNLPYRILQICTGDLGPKNAKQFDLEVWFPSQQKYRETHSCSWLGDFQARRSNIKYRDNSGNKHFVHTLNNTGIATPRILAALLENGLQPDGSVKIPEKLVSYTKFKVIK